MYAHPVWWVWSEDQVLQLSEKRDGPQPVHGARQVLNRDIANLISRVPRAVSYL